ncbi:phospholipase-like protein [Tanacetum coccineum]
MSTDTYNDKPSAPNPQHENEEVSPEKYLDGWLKANMEKHMCGQDNESEEDALIDILKSLVGECKSVYTNKSTQIETSSGRTNEVQGVSFVVDDEEGDTSGALPCQLPPKELNPGSFTLPCTISNLNLYVMADLGASVNVMPKSIFEYLKLASLKETIIVVEMADMTKKDPLGIVENILLQYMLRLMFSKENSLGIGEDRVKFDMDRDSSNDRTRPQNAPESYARNRSGGALASSFIHHPPPDVSKMTYAFLESEMDDCAKLDADAATL